MQNTLLVPANISPPKVRKKSVLVKADKALLDEFNKGITPAKDSKKSTKLTRRRTTFKYDGSLGKAFDDTLGKEPLNLTAYKKSLELEAARKSPRLPKVCRGRYVGRV